MNHHIKPIAGILTSRTELRGEVVRRLEEKFGAHDIIGEWRTFDHSEYYRDEMGDGLYRTFVSFEQIVAPEESVQFKGWTSGIENDFAVDGRRLVNIDAGYIDANKVVLMTAKHGAHKIAVAKGVWADMLLWYNKGWVAMPWAFPDFRDGGYFPLFQKMRTRYKSQLKNV